MLALQPLCQLVLTVPVLFPLQLERLRGENAALSKRVAGQQALEREVGELRSLLLQLYGRLGEKPPARLQRAMADTGHTADSDKPAEEEDSKLALVRHPLESTGLPAGGEQRLKGCHGTCLSGLGALRTGGQCPCCCVTPRRESVFALPALQSSLPP